MCSSEKCGGMTGDREIPPLSLLDMDPGIYDKYVFTIYIYIQIYFYIIHMYTIYIYMYVYTFMIISIYDYSQ